MPVREARQDDIAEVAMIVREHAVHEGASELCHFDERRGGDALFGPHRSLRALIASPDGAPDVVAGCTLWYPTFSSWTGTAGIWVEDIYVRPQYRNQGLGREMLDQLRSMTSGRIEWDVHVDNAAARAFYLRLGATPVSEWTKFRWLA